MCNGIREGRQNKSLKNNNNKDSTEIRKTIKDSDRDSTETKKTIKDPDVIGIF